MVLPQPRQWKSASLASAGGHALPHTPPRAWPARHPDARRPEASHVDWTATGVVATVAATAEWTMIAVVVSAVTLPSPPPLGRPRKMGRPAPQARCHGSAVVGRRQGRRPRRARPLGRPQQAGRAPIGAVPPPPGDQLLSRAVRGGHCRPLRPCLRQRLEPGNRPEGSLRGEMSRRSSQERPPRESTSVWERQERLRDQKRPPTSRGDQRTPQPQ